MQNTYPHQLPKNFEPAPIEKASYIDIHEQLRAVQTEVRYELEFSKNASHSDWEQGLANCHGFATLSSEKLDREKIKHSIIFLNGHSALVIPVENRLYFFEPAFPKLNQYVEDKLSIVPQTKTEERGLAMLNAGRFAIDADLNWVEAPSEHPWMISGSFNPLSSDHSDSNLSKRRLIATIFEPATGREVLSKYVDFHDALDDGDLLSSAFRLLEIGNLFPDLDIRSGHPKIVVKMVKNLARTGDIELAGEVTETFFANLSFSDDSRVGEYHADCLRYIAKYSRIKSVATAALTLYQKSYQKRQARKGVIADKIRSTQILTGQLN